MNELSKRIIIITSTTIAAALVMFMVVIYIYYAATNERSVEHVLEQLKAVAASNKDVFLANTMLGQDKALDMLKEELKASMGLKFVYWQCGAGDYGVTEGLKNMGSNVVVFSKRYALNSRKVCSLALGKSMSTVISVGEYKRSIYLMLAYAFITLLMMATVILYSMKRYFQKPMSDVFRMIDELSCGSYDIQGPQGKTEFHDVYGKLSTLGQNIVRNKDKLAQQSRDVAIGRISSHVAHDMRSPLSVLKTYAGLKTAASDDPDVENLRQSAQRSVGKLERMAEDLVDYAKASKLQKAQYQLSGIIYEGSIAEAKKKAEDHGVKISCAMQGGIIVNVDAYKLERVITNLINNAVQSIENGNGEVSIAATTEHNGVLKITVRDNGKGIDPEALPHIFDSFFTKGKKGGSGLGLAYCKQVIEAHGGTIDVASEIEKGTTFTIKIPNCAQEHAEPTACHSRESGNLETPTPGSPIKAFGDDILMDPGSKPAPAGGKPGVGMTIVDKQILIADDDPDIRQQWHKIIPEHGGTIVHTAKTVKEVEEATLDYSKIDTAIVDYQFYGEDKTGIDLIKYLKAKGVKTVYLCTGFYDNEVIINQAQAAGVDRILPKPIDPMSLRV